MTLSTHISRNNSLIGQYLWQMYRNTAPLSRSANQQLAGSITIRPQASNYPWSTVSRAMAYRLCFSFGISSQQLLPAMQGAKLLVDRHGEHYSNALMREFFAHSRQLLANLDPVGHSLTHTQELSLGQLCYVLATIEEVALMPRYFDGPLFQPVTRHTLTDLLTIPSTTAINDLAQMGELLTSRQYSLLKSSSISFPKLEGARIIRGGNPEIMIDDMALSLQVSTEPKVDAHRLRRLMGYILLDFTDVHKIGRVGIYLARQGKLISWPLEQFIATIGNISLSELPLRRQEFHYICRAAYGLTLPTQHS
jgi:hypothetical protein